MLRSTTTTRGGEYIMNKTVFITGTSTGIGRATAAYFAEQGWNVAATMRMPELEKTLHNHPKIELYRVDVTDPQSIDEAIKQVVSKFGRIDVVVNNAGFTIDGVFEATSDADIQKQFDTNVFGLMRVTRSIIPFFREQGTGVIVQVASMGGRITFPLYSIYHATKWAVEGFSESLHYEMESFGIRIKIIEPGAINTDFYGRSRTLIAGHHLPMYAKYVEMVNRITVAAGAKGEEPEAVAKVIYRAATDGSSKMRYAIGYPAPILLFLRRILPTRVFLSLIKRSYHL